MEDLVQSPPSLNQQEEEEDDEVYEQIEAPKFVDFTLPDLSLPSDDPSWFCLRIGCDQKHKEIDPDALHKSFVRRVMAARSPNVGENKKCPLSAPAKSKISRMTVITSVSQKIVDAKVKSRHRPKLNNMTPNVKAMEATVAAKCFTTTPRYKKCITNADHFRSVQHPKVSVAASKSTVVAKALVFQSPKKTINRKKVLLECEAPVTEICAKMKKLEISRYKKVSGNYSKPWRSNARLRSTSKNASDSSKSQLDSQNTKNRIVAPRDHNEQEIKSLTCMRKQNPRLRKSGILVPEEGVDSKSSNSVMDIDRTSKDISPDVISISASSRSNENQESLLPIFGALTSIHGECTKDVNGSISNNVRGSKENDSSLGFDQIPNEVRNEINEGNLHVNNIDLTNHQEKDTSEKGDLSLVRSSEGVIPEHETVDFADKENAAATDHNSDVNQNVNHPQRRLGQRRPHENCQKVIDETLAKSVKGSSAMPSTAFQVVQYKKPKPTSPKPFRLRTNERRILREANLEKRHIVPPIKENTPVFGVEDGKSERRGNSKKGVKPVHLQSAMYVVEPKTATISTLRGKKIHQVQDVKDKGAQKVRTAAKSQLSKQQLVYTQRVAVMREATIYEIPPGRLSVIKEMSSTVSRLRAAKPATIPKESNFLKAHMGYKKMPAKTISWQ
ncbi:hypothetical protein GIB67_029970 [Kingdonia uniflora]|uniref:Uncharacterized protein n=1 Tax=Kingdonia uniflora TaxID=39325 RepID=A0A7J7MY63_9MAGN|nr:hypothetical protein GIB67_029970 [Kingdonia uniflora]